MTPSEVRGVLNDAVSVYFLDALLAGAFVVAKPATTEATAKSAETAAI